MQTLQPIIKPVSLACNLGCSYCYYGPPRKEEFRPRLGKAVDKITIMSDETLEILIKEFAQCDPLPQFVWHGGEPLLCGIEFFEKIVAIQEQYLGNRKFENILQTNGTLITNAWAEYFANHNFRVGVSFDGTPETHDVFRTHQSGSGSSAQVIGSIKLLQKYGVNPSVISTVTRANIKKARDTYCYLRALNITHIQFNHLHERERLGDRGSIAIKPAEYAEFLIEIMDEWVKEDSETVEIVELRSLIQILTGGSEKGCIFSGICDRYLTIEYDGGVSWCDTIGKPHEIQVFGNIRDGLVKLTTSAKFQAFQRQLAELHERSKNEPWYPFVSFGCIGDYANLPWENSNTNNSFAEGWMKLIQAVADRLSQYGFDLKLTPPPITSP